MEEEEGQRRADRWTDSRRRRKDRVREKVKERESEHEAEGGWEGREEGEGGKCGEIEGGEVRTMEGQVSVSP